MEYKGYLARIEFDAEANIFHGEVINIRDVITFQGKTVGERRKAFEDSVEDYLAFCAERTVRLSPEQHRKVILAAEKAGKRYRDVGSRDICSGHLNTTIKAKGEKHGRECVQGDRAGWDQH